MTTDVDANRRLPLEDLRVLDYGQYVAAPFATMLMADLGAEVIKVEPPAGDAWRHYEPISEDGGKAFFALNRNKKSVVADLKTAAGRDLSNALIRSADVVVHNMPAARAQGFGLDREAVRVVNPQAVWVNVSAFGSAGPEASSVGYDLIAQAASGLLLADAREEDDVPRRSGGIAMADLTAGLLALASALAGLTDRYRRQDGGPSKAFEVSLLGSSLGVQVQRFIDVGAGSEATTATSIDRGDLVELARGVAEADRLEPYYRCYEASDGYLALACLNVDQRSRALGVLGLEDPWVTNPQAAPLDEAEDRMRAELRTRFADVIRQRTVAAWIKAFGRANVPVGPVSQVQDLHHSAQVHANGLVQHVHQPGVGELSLLGSLFKIDGLTMTAQRPAPRLGEHSEPLARQLSDTVEPEGGSRP